MAIVVQCSDLSTELESLSHNNIYIHIKYLFAVVLLVSPLFWRLRGKQNFAMVKSVMNLITMGFTIVSLRLLFFSLFLTSSIFSLTPPQPSCLAACSVSVVTQKGFQRGECYVFYIPRLVSQKKNKIICLTRIKLQLWRDGLIYITVFSLSPRSFSLSLSLHNCRSKNSVSVSVTPNQDQVSIIRFFSHSFLSPSSTQLVLTHSQTNSSCWTHPHHNLPS